MFNLMVNDKKKDDGAMEFSVKIYGKDVHFCVNDKVLIFISPNGDVYQYNKWGAKSRIIGKLIDDKSYDDTYPYIEMKEDK